MEAYRDELRDLQLNELAILNTFKELCERHGLIYYLIGGTLLGAVRHEGFIPWDDDIDVSMPRPDYEKFLDIASKELSAPYALCTKDIDPRYSNPFARVINKGKRVKTAYTKNAHVNYVWIDVFPMDAMPKNKIHYFFRKYHILIRRYLYVLSVFSDLALQTRERHGLEKLFFSLANKWKIEEYFDSEKQLSKLQGLLKAYPYDKGRYIGQLLGSYKFKYMMLREVYEPGRELIFEGEKFCVPQDYDALLSNLYGNYMELPPEDSRDRHRLTFLDD